MNQTAPNTPINSPANRPQNRLSVITVSLLVSTRALSDLSNLSYFQYLVCDVYGVECDFMIRFFFLWMHMFKYVFSLDAYHLFCNSARSMGKKYQFRDITILFLVLRLNLGMKMSP